MSFKQVLLVSLLVVAAAEIDQSEGLEISGRQLKVVNINPSPSTKATILLPDLSSPPIPVYPGELDFEFERFQLPEFSIINPTELDFEFEGFQLPEFSLIDPTELDFEFEGFQLPAFSLSELVSQFLLSGIDVGGGTQSSDFNFEDIDFQMKSPPNKF